MQRYQNALLAGVAALAIATGSGFAFAQTHGGGSTGGGMSSGNTGSGEQSPATQAAPSAQGEGSGMSEHPGTGMQHGGTGPGSTGAGMRSQAQEHPGTTQQKSEGGAKRSAQGAGSGTPSTVESGTHAGKREAQAPDHGAKGQKGGAAMEGHGAAPATGTQEGSNGQPSGGVKFSERQRTTIKRTIIDAHSAPRADHVDFDVRVGSVVPRDSIHVITVPETLVRIEPQWRGFLYFVYEDDVVIVDPNDMHIVAVVEV